MRWIIEFTKALPIVAVTAVLVSIPIVFHSKATGLAALIGTMAEGLITVGIANLVIGFILWRVLAIWLR